jgi:hypothetical protein
VWHRLFGDKGLACLGIIVKLIFVAAAVLMGFQRRWDRFFWDKEVQCLDDLRSPVEAFCLLWWFFFWVSLFGITSFELDQGF